MRTSGLWLITAGAVLALAACATSSAQRVAAVRAADASTPAPIVRDYDDRDELVAFWEGAVRERHRNDMLSPRVLAGEYLQRYRERGDISDVLRAKHMAERSLAIQPNNIAATNTMASVMLTLHRFREALHYVKRDVAYDPQGPEFLAQAASYEMELGQYATRRATLDRHRSGAAQRGSPSSPCSLATTNSPDTSTTVAACSERAAVEFETNASAPAAGTGVVPLPRGRTRLRERNSQAAVAEEQTAIGEFPGFNLAWKDLAKFELRASTGIEEALGAATTGASITPFPETLGYEADAQAALGDTRRGAAATQDLIFAIERIGNGYHVNDRLLAVYYAEHHLRPSDALTIARREVNPSGGERGDEIYGQDTLAWAAAMDGRWALARSASVEARSATVRRTRSFNSTRGRSPSTSASASRPDAVFERRSVPIRIFTRPTPTKRDASSRGFDGPSGVTVSP